MTQRLLPQRGVRRLCLLVQGWLPAFAGQGDHPGALGHAVEEPAQPLRQVGRRMRLERQGDVAAFELDQSDAAAEMSLQ